MIRQYELGNSLPGAEVLAGLASLGFDTQFLLTGIRSVKVPAQEFEVTRKSGSRKQSAGGEALESTEYVSLPLYDLRAAAGGGAIVESEQVVDVLKFKREWIARELHANQKDLCLLYVDGDSMEPELRPGDIILVDRSDVGPNRDGVYVLRMDESLLVKRLQRLPGGGLRVTSDNEKYEAFTIKFREAINIAIIGRVVWAGRRM